MTSRTPRSPNRAPARRRAVSTAATRRRRRRRAGSRRRAVVRARRLRTLRRTLIGAGITAAAVVLVVVLSLSTAQAPICVDDPETFPAAGVEGWSGEQLDNAATIMRTAVALGFGRDGQILGVMTAMGESGLRNIDYGDWETIGFRNPDGTRTTSIGLFQQQDWWGSVEERMDPATAATLFYGKLAVLDGWQQLPPSHAIHRVQVNTDADYYTQYESDAVAVVDRLNGGCSAA